MATLPEKTDPDSLIRDQGVEVFESLLNETPGALAYLIEQQLTRRKSNDRGGSVAGGEGGLTCSPGLPATRRD